MVTKTVPTMVSAFGMSASQVVTGYNFTCVRKLDGSLWCWGENNQGQLGIGSVANSVPTPTQLVDLGMSVTDAAGGTYHACAMQAGNMWCWGSNQEGAIGDGTVGSGSACAGDCKPSPVKLSITNVAQISAGAQHTCVRKNDNSMWCWGANFTGQLGDGTQMRNPSPSKVAAIATTAKTVLAANDISCAAKNDGTLSCWGTNVTGELGDGTILERDVPTKTMTLMNATQVANKYTFTCVIEAGGVWCWGDNSLGQLGIGKVGGTSLCADTKMNCELSPLRVMGLCP
jgi:hypothetical protein